MDLDLGNYERFLDLTLTKDNNLTTGKVYQVGRRLSHRTQLLLPHYVSSVMALYSITRGMKWVHGAVCH